MDKVMEFIPSYAGRSCSYSRIICTDSRHISAAGSSYSSWEQQQNKTTQFYMQGICVDFQRNTAATAAVLLLLLFPTGSQYTDECFYHGGSDICA